MRSRAALTLLVLLTLALPLSHLQLQQFDQRWLLVVDGRLVDVSGRVSEQINRLLRDCRDVRLVPADDGLHAQALKRLQQHSPPDSHSARLLRLWQSGDWLLAEVDFDRLAPAVVPMRSSSVGLEIALQGVWSGTTHPHWPAPFVRSYMARQLPQVPSNLLACFEPGLPLFRTGRPDGPAGKTTFNRD